MNDSLADLHIHTVYSDGIDTPEEIVSLSESSGLKIISITDHDTVDAYLQQDIISFASKNNIEIIPGIEFSADYATKDNKNIEVHILGYFIDLLHPSIRKYCEEYQNMRYERAKSIIQKLNSMNVHLKMEDLNKEVKKDIYGRLHIAQALVKKGFVCSLKEAFKRFIGYNAPAFIPKKQRNTIDIIRIIKESGGVSIIAHPGLQGIETELAKLKNIGIDGVEVFHPDHSYAITQRLLEEAKRYSLLITGGSDYHGTNKEKLPLGCSNYSVEYAQRLKEAHIAEHH